MLRIDPYRKLVRDLKHADPDVRAAAVDQLVDAGPAAVPRLIRVLLDGPPLARKSATVALGRIGDARAVPHLCDQLVDEALANYREAADALAGIGHPSALPYFCARVRDAHVGGALQRLLEGLPSEEARAALPLLEKRFGPREALSLMPHHDGSTSSFSEDPTEVRRLVVWLRERLNPGHALPRPARAGSELTADLPVPADRC